MTVGIGFENGQVVRVTEPTVDDRNLNIRRAVKSHNRAKVRLAKTRVEAGEAGRAALTAALAWSEASPDDDERELVAMKEANAHHQDLLRRLREAEENERVMWNATLIARMR